MLEQRETYRNTLSYALAIAGGEMALAVRLRVTVAKLRDWLEGLEPVPDAAFLDAVDVIVRAAPADIARARELLQQRRKPGASQHSS